MRLATGIIVTALLLVAAALHLHGGDNTDNGVAAPVRVVDVEPGAAWPKMKRPAKVEAHFGAAEQRQAEAAPPADVSIDQQKFAAVYQAASALALASDGPNLTRSALREQLTALETAASVAAAQATTPSEVQMVGFYADAAVAYRDGLQFWELRRFADQPGESAALDALAEKYGIQAARKISYTATWQGYPNAFAKIWAVGNTAAAKGSALYNR